jgi:Tol biopolymer transport system component
VWRLDLTTNTPSLFLHPPAGQVTHLAHAPDQRRIAYAIDVADPANRLLSSEISVADQDGTNARTLVREAGEGYRVGWVSWPSDPAKLVYSKEHPARRVERVEEVDLTTGERTLVLEGGSSPFASPTQPMLAYATPAGSGWTIWALNRENDTRSEIVRAAWFDDADNPAFSPDGSLVAFVAAGAGPATAPSLQEIFMDLGRPRTASAHNLLATFFDLWVVRPDGGGLRRVAQLLDLQPEFAWSPDGRSIAAMGTLQLQVIDVETGESRGVPRPSGKGKLSWGAG